MRGPTLAVIAKEPRPGPAETRRTPELAPLAVYAAALGSPVGARVRGPRGVAALPVARWAGPADAADELAVSLLSGPVLDVGCGPGRHVALLAAAGVDALGIDPSPEAVQLAVRRGANAIVGSVFGYVPGAGTYGGALLLDGNIGIGGDPIRLLRRVARLIANDGSIVAEVEPRLGGDRVERVRLERPGAVSSWFDWARVGAASIETIAARAGLAVRHEAYSGGRVFVRLERRP